MPLQDAITLGAIVFVFVIFGIVLAGVSFYCRDRTGEAHRSSRSYPNNANLISDDD